MFKQNSDIDVLNKNLFDDEEAVYDDVICSLETIPSNVILLNERYILRGAAVFIGRKRAARTSMGHYVAVARRNDGNWQKYDDFQQKVSSISKTTKCAVQMILYTKE